MKRNYQKPTMRVVKIQHSGIICSSPGGDSGWGVIGPDEPDAPAGARQYNGDIDWDDRDDWDDWDDWDE